MNHPRQLTQISVLSGDCPLVMVPQHGVARDLRLTLVVYDHAHLGDAKLPEVENTT